MFGFRMRVEYDGFGVLLRPLKREELFLLADGFSSLEVNMWTGQDHAQTISSEEKWYEKVEGDQNSYLWSIVPDGRDLPIGVTSLNRIDIHGTCTSGIVVWDTSWWGKGVTTRSHLARTVYAADFLNRSTILSFVRTQNPASFSALKRVGYFVLGVALRDVYRMGKWWDTYHLEWINPERLSLCLAKQNRP